MLHWSRADFVRKVSTATFGFFDTLQPQRALIVGAGGAVAPEDGFPNLARRHGPAHRRPRRAARSAAGAPAGGHRRRRRAAWRGDDRQLGHRSSTTRASRPAKGSRPAAKPSTGRGNLLNPNYACEAYRYSTANDFLTGAARVIATGLTQYVTEDQIGVIRDPATGLLPRFLNVRLVR